jgi:hypothetical protein
MERGRVVCSRTNLNKKIEILRMIHVAITSFQLGLEVEKKTMIL